VHHLQHLVLAYTTEGMGWIIWFQPIKWERRTDCIPTNPGEGESTLGSIQSGGRIESGSHQSRAERQSCSRWKGEQKNKRPYLINFDATGSPCHELTSWDNSSSMSFWLGRKESHCEDILPVSSTDGAAISPTISLALSLWYTRKCEIKENLSSVPLLHVKLRNTK